MTITRVKFTPERKAKLIVFLNMLTLAGGVITVVLLLRVIGTAARQNADTNAKIVASQKLTEKDLGCLASFFSQPNRQALQITSLEHCTVVHTDTGKSEDLPLLPVTKTQSSPAVPTSDTKQNSTTTPTPTQSNNTTTNTPTPIQAPSQPTPQAKASTDVITTITVPPAKQLLGISICIPFTGVCMR